MLYQLSPLVRALISLRLRCYRFAHSLIASGQGGLGWGTAMECQQANCGTVPEHHYINTKITMSAANPNYSNTLALNGASGNLVTSDGGLTWTVDDITINQYTFT